MDRAGVWGEAGRAALAPVPESAGELGAASSGIVEPGHKQTGSYVPGDTWRAPRMDPSCIKTTPLYLPTLPTRFPGYNVHSSLGKLKQKTNIGASKRVQ